MWGKNRRTSAAGTGRCCAPSPPAGASCGRAASPSWSSTACDARIPAVAQRLIAAGLVVKPVGSAVARLTPAGRVAAGLISA